MLTYSGLDSYLSRDTQQFTNYTANTSLPTTLCVDTHNIGADESREWSNKEHTQTRESHSFLSPSTAWRTLPPLTPNKTNTKAYALPPTGLHSS